VEPMRGSVRNRPEEASFQGGRVSRAMTPDPGDCTSRWLHQQKAALKFQPARSGRWEAFFKAHINGQHWLASDISAETHHDTLEQLAA
jgi:hypothetical protein